MNHKLKIGLEIGGGLIAVYVLYKLYSNYQSNQQAAADANSMNSFLPPLQIGGYAPAQTTAGTVDTGGAQLNNLLQSILSPSAPSSTDTSSSGSTDTSSSGTGNFVYRGVTKASPVGPEPAPISGTYQGVGTRVTVPTVPKFISSTDGTGTVIV